MADPFDSDDDLLEGCDLVADDQDDPETAALRALFPDGVDDGRWDGVAFDGP